MTGKFLTALQVESLPGEVNWKLLAPLIYQSPIYGGAITIPTGFVTDFASVPRLPLIFALCGDAAQEAAVVHDSLYRNPHYTDRAKADAIFQEAMEATKVPWFRKKLMYWGVRAFGWSSKK